MGGFAGFTKGLSGVITPELEKRRDAQRAREDAIFKAKLQFALNDQNLDPETRKTLLDEAAKHGGGGKEVKQILGKVGGFFAKMGGGQKQASPAGAVPPMQQNGKQPSAADAMGAESGGAPQGAPQGAQQSQPMNGVPPRPQAQASSGAVPQRKQYGPGESSPALLQAAGSQPKPEDVAQREQDRKDKSSVNVYKQQKTIDTETAQAADKQQDADFEKYVATVPPEKAAELKDEYARSKFNLVKETATVSEDIKNIPGSAIKGKMDAFGNPIDEKGVYTKGKDGRFYPEIAAPKADPPEGAEIRERAKALMDKSPKLTEGEAMAQARSTWVRNQDMKAKGVTVNVENKEKANAPSKPVLPGSNDYKVAQSLAFGKLTFSEYRALIGYSRDINRKISIYVAATEINPQFNPAMFEMGFTLAKNPKVQQQLASLDNVRVGIPDLLGFSDAAERTGATILNKAVIPGGIALGGKTYSNFATARTAFADELSGALGYGSATDMSREMGFSMVDPALSPENFRSAILNVVAPFVERKKQTLLDQMGPYGMPGMNPAASKASPGGEVKPRTDPKVNELRSKYNY
jgi:hypothetical protein